MEYIGRDAGDPLAILVHVRHNCFKRGVLGSRSGDPKLDIPPDDDFRQAFRTLNKLYVALKTHPDATRAVESNANSPDRPSRHRKARKSPPVA